MKVVLFGASGTIGSAVKKALRRRDTRSRLSGASPATSRRTFPTLRA